MLLKEGVSDFAPYPEPAGALREAIDRLRYLRSSGGSVTGVVGGTPVRKGKLTTVYGIAGGVGASTIAVNLAWELANVVRKDGRRVVLLDFNFQYGSCATFLDVPRRESVYELVSEATNFDQTGLMQALSTYQDRLYVLTAPRDALPLDIVTPTDVKAIINLARESFDHVIIDMPQALMNWSEPVYAASDLFLAVMEVDMRSAQNMFRFLRTLKTEGMALEKLVFTLNRAPGMTDFSGKGRVSPRGREPRDHLFLSGAGWRQAGRECLRSGHPAARGCEVEPCQKGNRQNGEAGSDAGSGGRESGLSGAGAGEERDDVPTRQDDKEAKGESARASVMRRRGGRGRGAPPARHAGATPPAP